MLGIRETRCPCLWRERGIRIRRRCRPVRFQRRVVIVVGIAVEHQIAHASGEIYADSHTVVHGNVFDDVVVAVAAAETFRLGVGGDGDLCAHDVKVLKCR